MHVLFGTIPSMEIIKISSEKLANEIKAIMEWCEEETEKQRAILSVHIIIGVLIWLAIACGCCMGIYTHLLKPNATQFIIVFIAVIGIASGVIIAVLVRRTREYCFSAAEIAAESASRMKTVMIARQQELYSEIGTVHYPVEK